MRKYDQNNLIILGKLTKRKNQSTPLSWSHFLSVERTDNSAIINFFIKMTRKLRILFQIYAFLLINLKAWVFYCFSLSHKFGTSDLNHGIIALPELLV